MKILYIYRNPQLGYSIGKVFKPIEEEIGKYADVDSIYMPAIGYRVKSILANIRYVKRYISARDYDIIHITGTEHYLIPFLQSYKVVVTVHDLGSMYNNNLGKIQQYIKSLLFITPLKKADIVTFISEKSKEEARQYVNIIEEKKICISNAVDSSYKYNEKKINKTNPTILHLGTKPIKNIIRVAQALKNAKCQLRVIGKLSLEQITALTDNKINYSNIYGLTDEEIYDEYKKCDIVSFPSTYEGFGMPIIEGQSVGRVVVTSNLSPMKEVAGGGAVLVDPYSIESIRNGFEEAIVNHNKYIEIGRENVKKYTIKNIADQYFDLYKRMI